MRIKRRKITFNATVVKEKKDQKRKKQSKTIQIFSMCDYVVGGGAFNNGSAGGGPGCEEKQMNLVLNMLCLRYLWDIQEEMSNKALNVGDWIVGESKGVR